MNRYQVPLPKKTTEAMFDSWLKVIKRHESGMIVSLPYGDRHYRVEQFLRENQRELDGYTVKPIYLQTSRVESVESLMSALGTGAKRAVALVMDGEWLVTGAPHLWLGFREVIIKANHRLSVLAFLETNPEGLACQKLGGPHPLKQNVLCTAIYDRKATLHFIRYVEQQMSVRLPAGGAEQIWEKCGGLIWLAKEVVRHFAETNRLEYDFEPLHQKIQLIWEALGEEEREVLVQVVRGQSGERNLAEAERYLINVGLLKQTKHNLVMIVQILSEFVSERVRRKLKITVTHQGIIMVGDMAMPRSFSAREQKVIKNFVACSGEVVEREVVGEWLWPRDEDAYSDWALNQFMRRLRGHLREICGDEHVKTIKGHGFRWE